MSKNDPGSGQDVDVADFRDLAVAELDAVYRMAFHLTRHPDEAGDLVQETYLHNAFYTRLDKKRREPTLADDLRLEGAASELDHPAPCWDLSSLDWEQTDERLKQAIAELPVHYREVLLLWAVEGLKYKEVAQVLDVALGTVMSRLYRARAILSEKLAGLAEELGIAPGPSERATRS